MNWGRRPESIVRLATRDFCSRWECWTSQQAGKQAEDSRTHESSSESIRLTMRCSFFHRST